MTQNVLLSKSELGKVKTGFHVLPESAHVYGKPPSKDKYGARDAISNWQYHTPSGVTQPPKNFMEINKQGVGYGLTNSKDMTKFKNSNDTRIKVVEGKKEIKKELPPADFVYGVKNRPSTPIKNVVCNTYAKQGLQLAQQREAVMKLLQQKTIIKPQLAPKQYPVHVNRKQVIAQNNFKLSKFNNVQSKIKPLFDADKKKKKQQEKVEQE